MSSPLAGPAEDLTGHHVRQAASGLVLPDGPRHPRIVQAWLWLKKPTWFLDHCWRTYGDVFTMRLPLGNDLVHIADPELVKAVFGGNADVLRAVDHGDRVGPLGPVTQRRLQALLLLRHRDWHRHPPVRPTQN
jgi:hypothetical protein